MKLRMSKTQFRTAILIIIVIVTIASVCLCLYYYSYPNNFQISGRFSARGINIGKSFERSTITASSFVIRNFEEDDKFNITIEATRGWKVKELTIYNASIRQYPIIYDVNLFSINGSVSLKISEPQFLFVSPQNLSASIYTGKADSAFFIAEAGTSLLIENVTSAYVPFSKGISIVYFQIVGGNISISDGTLLFNLSNKKDIIAIRLEMQILVDTEIDVTGKFAVESNAFSSLEIECWSSPLEALFGFPEGFLSYSSTIQKLSGSQNLNLKGFRGAITLLNSQSNYEITMQGYADRIYIGQIAVTDPDPLRDLVVPFNQLWLAIIAGVVSWILRRPIEEYWDRRKEKREQQDKGTSEN